MEISWETEHRPETAEVPRQKLDALIVLGRNFLPGFKRKEIEAQRHHLSPDSRINVLAAGLLYKAGFADKIIFSTGHTAGEDLPSEAQAMKSHLLRIFPSIPEEAIILEEISLDTQENAKEVKKIIDKYKFENVGLLTVRSHLKRAIRLFEKAGLTASPFASEETLKDKRAKFINNYMSSDLGKKIAKQERIVALVQPLPLGAQFLRMVVKLTRGN